MTLTELASRIETHPARQAQQYWDEVARNWDVLRRNIIDLQQLVARAESDEDFSIELVQNVRPSPVRADFVSRFDQRLFNVLGAFSAWRDQMYRLGNQYPQSPFQAEAHRRMDAVKATPVFAFMTRLRNFTQHRSGVFRFSHTMSVDLANNRSESKVVLHRDMLMSLQDKDHKWTGAAKTYIGQCGEAVQVSVAVDECWRTTAATFDWVVSQFRDLHGNDVDNLKALVDEYRRMTGRLAPT